MIKCLKRLYLRCLSDQGVLRRYTAIGTSFGDGTSYSYMGEWIGFEKDLTKWAYWERAVAERGYRTTALDDFIDAGGYGKPLPPPSKRDPGEEPVYHADRYIKKWRGKQTVFGTKTHEGGAVSATYILPSTRMAPPDEEEKK